MQKIILICIALILPSLAYAWNSNGHRVIAQIAYENLKPAVKKRIDGITKGFDRSYNARSRFLYAAIWPDKIKYDGVLAFDDWHFINYGYSPDGTQAAPIQTENVVWAIGQSEHTLLSPTANTSEKALALSFLIHFAGDAHQPLHCAVRYTRQFPSGDKNGLLFPIDAADANNLHNYWDAGLGLFDNTANNTAMSDQAVGRLAEQIQQNYPKKNFAQRTYQLKANQWATQSFQIAVNFAYNGITENKTPSAQYTEKGRTIVEQQVALAGYRLANLLNALFSNSNKDGDYAQSYGPRRG